MLLLYLLLNSGLPGAWAATDPHPAQSQHPSATLQDIINQFQTSAVELASIRSQVRQLFTCADRPSQYIQLHSWKPGMQPRSIFCSRPFLAEGLQHLRALWQKFPAAEIAAVTPEPPPLENFAEERAFVLWEPGPRDWVIGLWDIRSAANRLLKRQAVNFPRRLTHQRLLDFVGFSGICRRNFDPCRWLRGNLPWLPLDISEYALQEGFYVQVRLPAAVPTLDELWSQLSLAPPHHHPHLPAQHRRIGEAENPGQSM